MSKAQVLLIEPFCGGSHEQLMKVIQRNIPDTELVSLPAKKWHWKARTSALYLSQVIPRSHTYRVLFASSVLNLCELVALRPDLAQLRKILYFHENQLVYPIRKQQERDFQFGYNQILSSLVADEVFFNSKYNMESFLSGINSHLKLIPDHRPKDVPQLLKPKCKVLHFPLTLPDRHRDWNADGKTTDGLSKEPINTSTSMSNHSVMSEDLDKKSTENVSHVSSNVKTDNLKNQKDICKNPQPAPALDGCHGDQHINSKQSVEHSAEEILTPCSTMASDDGGKSVKRLKMGDPVSSGEDIVPNSGSTGDDRQLMLPRELQDPGLAASKLSDSLHIVWPHRWEHDKNPEMFFRVLYQLKEAGLKFRVSVMGENYAEVPEIFGEAHGRLGDRISHWGYQDSKFDYYRVLRAADCVISTANHEFFGVAMLEAVYLGCYPLCPNRLVYPEIFPKEYLYNTENQLFKRLKQFCLRPDIVRRHKLQVDVEIYSWKSLEPAYQQLLLGK